MGAMAFGGFITILLLFHQIPSSIQQSSQLDRFTFPNDRDEIVFRDGWFYLARTASWYKAMNERITFDEAEAYCVEQKSHLVSIHSQGENDFVQRFATLVRPYDRVWIGLKRNPNNANSLEWTDGSSVDFTNWKEDESVWGTHTMLSSGDGKWSIFPWDQFVHFICKRSSQF